MIRFFVFWLIGSNSLVNTHAFSWHDYVARILFAKFKSDYGKNYNGYDNEYRFNVFKQNLNRAQQYQREELGTARYGVTRFSDLTAEEFNTQFTNARFDSKVNLKLVEFVPDVESTPSSFDWRTKGAVGPVENQGACGSCWAFSVVGNIEAQWFLKHGQLYSLSKQQLVDCDYEDSGCGGGNPLMAYDEIVWMRGLERTVDYPYVGRDQSCHMKNSKFVAYINDSITLPEDEQAQASWLVQNGPMSVALNADPLQFYVSGILRPRRCPKSGLNHAVLTVGYGAQKSKPFWIVKNSWGLEWGEMGYFRIYRGAGTCGINTLCSSSVVK